jgi:TIR domain
VAHSIFISYRRDDAEGEAGRLFDDLTRAFGSESVFMDVADIRPGADFRRAIDESVAHCGVFLAVIGAGWITITSPDGHRRLDNPDDFVALEVGSALRRNVPVIPVLVHGAHMPPPDQLPEALRDLSFRNSVELSHARWNSDVQLLIEALRSYVAPNPVTEEQPVHATVPVQLPAPHAAPAPPSTTPPMKPKMGLILGVLGVIVVVIVAIIVLSSRSGPSGSGSGQGASSSSAAAPATGQPAANPSALVGRWIDTNPRSGNSLYALEIDSSGGQVSIHGWGACDPQPCDWGTQTASFDGTTASATFSPKSSKGEARSAMVSLRTDGPNLDVNVVNTFADSSGSHQNQVHRTFVPHK